MVKDQRARQQPPIAPHMPRFEQEFKLVVSDPLLDSPAVEWDPMLLETSVLLSFFGEKGGSCRPA
jgi:hypothetical protein